MAKSCSGFHDTLIQLSDPIRESLSKTSYTPPESSNVSIKSVLESLLPLKTPNPIVSDSDVRIELRNFALCCALLSSANVLPTSDLYTWIPDGVSHAAKSAFRQLASAYFDELDVERSKMVSELGLECGSLSDEKKFVIELLFDVLPLLKDSMKESSIDKLDDVDEFSAASARVPVAYAIVAAYQFSWFVTQVDYPNLGKLCFLVIPCALTALDHWSPEVKGQGMATFIHLAKNVDAAELSVYEDVILDTCCQNIASNDEIWHLVVEMSVLVVVCTQRSNPRSLWFERLLNEMFSHLERQPRNKERRASWLELIEPLFDVLGLMLLAHSKRIFPLFLQWMHADDDQTVKLVLKRLQRVIKLTWIRNTPYVERLVDELAIIYKEASLRKAREQIRTDILQTLSLLQQCKGSQFESAWEKHRDDPNLATLAPSLNRQAATEC